MHEKIVGVTEKIFGLSKNCSEREGKRKKEFSIPGLREIHRNLKQQKNFNSCDGFFRKSPFCTFSCINPGFWAKKIKFHAPVQKFHFGNFSIFPKWNF